MRSLSSISPVQKTKLLAPNHVNFAAIYFPEVVCRHGETKKDDIDPHYRAIRQMHHTSTKVTTEKRSGCHAQAILPIHLPFDDEYRHGHRSEAARQGVLERYDRMDIGQSNQAKCANHQDSDAGAKISAIDCYEKQEQPRGNLEGNGPRRRRFMNSRP